MRVNFVYALPFSWRKREHINNFPGNLWKIPAQSQIIPGHSGDIVVYVFSCLLFLSDSNLRKQFGVWEIWTSVAGSGVSQPPDSEECQQPQPPLFLEKYRNTNTGGARIHTRANTGRCF